LILQGLLKLTREQFGRHTYPPEFWSCRISSGILLTLGEIFMIQMLVPKWAIATLLTSSLFLLLSNCGSYSSEDIALSDAQLAAIRSKLSTECVANNSVFFASLKTAFTTAINTQAEMPNRAYYTVTYNNNGSDTTFDLGVYKIYNNTIYFIAEPHGSETKNRVYKFTLDDQNRFISDSGNLTSTICTLPNTFNNVVADFHYTIKYTEPDTTNDNRIEYVMKYINSSSIPLFFSVFNNEYVETEYENGTAKAPIKRTYTMKRVTPTDADRDALLSQTKFDAANHCEFSGITDWGALSYTGVDFSTLATCVSSTSTTGRFSWNDVDPSTN
jgi:hypothetical protein